MCRLMEQMREEAVEEAAEKAKLNQAKEDALGMFEASLPVKTIAMIVKYPIEVVAEWLGVNPAQA